MVGTAAAGMLAELPEGGGIVRVLRWRKNSGCSRAHSAAATFGAGIALATVTPTQFADTNDVRLRIVRNEFVPSADQPVFDPGLAHASRTDHCSGPEGPVEDQRWELRRSDDRRAGATRSSRFPNSRCVRERSVRSRGRSPRSCRTATKATLTGHPGKPLLASDDDACRVPDRRVPGGFSCVDLEQQRERDDGIRDPRPPPWLESREHKAGLAVGDRDGHVGRHHRPLPL